MWSGLGIAMPAPPTRSAGIRRICSIWQGSLFPCVRPPKTSRQRLVTYEANFRQTLGIVSKIDTNFRVEAYMCVPKTVGDRSPVKLAGPLGCEGKCNAEQRAACPLLSMMAALKSAQQTVPELELVTAHVLLRPRQPRHGRRRYRSADRLLKNRRNQKSGRRSARRKQRPLSHCRASNRIHVARR